MIPVPTVSFNAIYQLLHIYKHLFEEGIGLRQLLDYYFVLRALHIEQGSLADCTPSMAQWAEGMGIAVASYMTIEDLFFQLLQVAIGNRKTLSKTPSADEWRELFALSKKQEDPLNLPA